MTIILFVVTLAIYVISVVVKRDEAKWLSLFLSVCAIAQTLIDETLVGYQNIILIVPAFYVMLISGVDVMMRRN